MPDRDGWTSPSELAEYAFCPRAWHYRTTRGPAPASASSNAGTAYHARELSAQRWRSEHPLLPWAVAVLGVVLLLGAWLSVGGFR